MYPSSGFLSYEFDDVNRKIIQTTKQYFVNKDINQRVQNYLSVLNDIRKSDPTGSIEVLEPAGSAFSSLIRIEDEIVIDPDSLNSLIINLSPDSAFAFATMGFIELKMNQINQSKKNFSKAFELDSNFVEVEKYLSLIYETDETDQFKKVKSKRKKEVNADRKKTSAAKRKNAVKKQ